jgi:hypothetical protein
VSWYEQTRDNNQTTSARDFSCVNPQCELYGQRGQNNLKVRKTYGKDSIRYLGCQRCGADFSERRSTALWNRMVSGDRVLAIAEHLAEGCSLSRDSANGEGGRECGEAVEGSNR